MKGVQGDETLMSYKWVIARLQDSRWQSMSNELSRITSITGWEAAPHTTSKLHWIPKEYEYRRNLCLT